MDYKIKEPQQYGYSVNGTIKVFGRRWITADDQGDWDCPVGCFYYVECSNATISTGFGNLAITWELIGGPLSANSRGADAEAQPVIRLNWTLSSNGVIDSGYFDYELTRAEYCRKVIKDYPEIGENLEVAYASMPPDLDSVISFSLQLSTEFTGYMTLHSIDDANSRCLCADENGVPDLCGPLWCQFPMQHDACGIPATYGFCWLESEPNPTINYSCSVGGSSSSGTYDNEHGLPPQEIHAKIINPSGAFTVLLQNSSPMPAYVANANVVMATASMGTIGLAMPDIENCVYENGSRTIATINGSTLSLYRAGGYTSIYDNFGLNATWTIEHGSYAHHYGNKPVYCDGKQFLEGEPQPDCRVSELVPYWDETNHIWTTAGLLAYINVPGSVHWGGKWTLGCNTGITGPYHVPNTRTAIMDQTSYPYDALGDWGLYRSISSARVENPGELGQPEHIGAPVEPPCVPDTYKDKRMLMLLDSYPSVNWNAMKLTVPASKLAHTFNLTTTPENYSYSAVVDLTDQHISVWGARFLKLTYTGDSDPISVIIDGRVYSGITPTNNVIDILCPDNHTGSETHRSLIGAIQPQSVATTEPAVPWDLGIYKLNVVEFNGLKKDTSYHFDKLEMIHKTAGEGGSFTAIILPEASWQDRDPESDTVSCDYAGQSATTNQNGKVWYQSCGWVFCDGALCGEIIINRFDRKPNFNCGNGSTGWRWFVLPVDISDPKFACYTGEVGGFLSSEVIDSKGDNLTGYLNPGVYHGNWNGTNHEITLTATMRVDSLMVPACWGDEYVSLEKYFNGLCAVRAINEDKTYTSRTVRFTSGVGGGAKAFDVITDPFGFGITYAPPGDNVTHSLPQTQVAHATYGSVTATVPIRNRKCSLLTIKGTETLKLRYCASDGQLKTNPNGTLSLECSC